MTPKRRPLRPVDVDPIDDSADEFGPGGRAIFDSLARDNDPAEITALIVEAARMKDRLDKFDMLLSGDVDAWCRLIPSDDGPVYELRVSGAMTQSRQTATVFRQTLAEIVRLRANDDDDDDDPMSDL